ncbi:methyltransferase [Yersinia mollaretii]|uniref:Methyltransferase n=1 Tax=Yersinia mollaretii TaxID=33060 RepID=A0AA44CPP4_YERMO|nr:methyltransferase [Yersinia mollaretii]CNK33190.1 putative O-methyltransferase [Yersinia enterocolitica]NIL24670.1 methyltransferase [Yersinia mollaretii]CNI93966.1 putative O-methyltransferase [Yersinia mollaretii]CNK04191.1 putative O-methyltransferase [Yersinia mollaretii]CQQ12751.1 putative O-methyltransferase [Yersinia mollaretii]
MVKNNPLKYEGDTAALYLLEQAMGFTFQASLRAAAILGIADHLTKGAKTAEELGQAVGADWRLLNRVLRMLASRHIFAESENGQFSLTPAAEFLRTDNNNSLRSAVLMLTDKTFWLPLGNLVENLRGESAFKQAFGMSFYEYWSQENIPESDSDFHTGMSSMSSVENNFLVRSYDFPEHATVVDIAGGFGGLLLKVLQHNPTLHGILFDRPAVLARNRLGELGDDSRWETQSGNFFESCPSADIYLLKYITMDWPEEQASKILRSCRNAMRPNSKVLILEPVISREDTWQGGKEIDLLLLGSFDGGQARTEEELKVLLASADLKLNRIIDTGSYVSIIEAIPR